MILRVCLCNSCLNYVSNSNLYICAHMPTCLTLYEFRYTGGNPPLSPLRGFEHVTASNLISPFHQHSQVLRRMRYLHWHLLARSRVSRHRIQQWPNLWTSQSLTTHPYPNSTSACSDSLVTTLPTSLLTALEPSELPKHEPEIRLLPYIYM